MQVKEHNHDDRDCSQPVNARKKIRSHLSRSPISIAQRFVHRFEAAKAC
jgi:hypothetical protein